MSALAPARSAPERRQAKPAPTALPHVERPAAAPRLRPARRPRIGWGVVWIAAVGVLLAGIVALNVAVLRLHLRSGEVADDIAKLRAENADLVAELSSATAVGRIDALGRRLGLVEAAHPTYVRLPPRVPKPR